MPAVIAILDANALIPAAPRDTLLRAAEQGLYQVRWSDEILNEVSRNLVRHGMTSEVDARDLIHEMRSFFPEAQVTDYESLIAHMTNEPKDRHVLAAAVRANAGVIVTQNLSDFPFAALVPLGIRAQSIDAFLTDLFLRSPSRMTRIVREQAADLEDPPLSVEEVLDEVAQTAPEFVVLVLQQTRLK